MNKKILYISTKEYRVEYDVISKIFNVVWKDNRNNCKEFLTASEAIEYAESKLSSI